MSACTLFYPFVAACMPEERQPWLAQWPALAETLRFAQPVPAPGRLDVLQRQAHWLHQPAPLPFAPITARCDLQAQFDPQAFYMRLDPVHLRPDRDTLVLFDAQDVRIAPQEEEALIAAFNEHFAEEGVRIQRGGEGRWYVSLPQPVDIRTVSLPMARYANLHDVQPTGEAARLWRRLINEAQMLFHMHPVNEARRERDLPEINGLWLWGEGRYPQNLRDRPALHVYSQDFSIQALAQSVSATLVEAASLPETLGPQQAWYLDMREHRPDEALDTALAAILARVKSGEIRSFLLDLGFNAAWHLTPKDFRRFWRRWRRPHWPESVEARSA